MTEMRGPGQHESDFRAAPEVGEMAESKQSLAERHPDWPPVVVELYLAPHSSVFSVPRLKELLSKADVYLFEAANPRPGLVNQWQDVANTEPVKQPFLDIEVDKEFERRESDRRTRRHGDQNIYQEPLRGRGSFTEMQIRALYGSNVAVGHTDLVPDENAGDAELRQRIRSADEMAINAEGTFDEALASLEEIYRVGGQAQNERERTKCERLESELSRIFQEHPDLLGKKEVRVVETLGAAHRGFARKLEGAGYRVEVVADRDDDDWDYAGDAELAVWEGQPVTREMMAMAYGEALVLGAIEDRIPPSARSEDTYDWQAYLRYATSLLRPQDVEAVHQHLHDGGWSSGAYADLRRVLEVRGLGSLPQTAHDLHERVKQLSRA